MGIYVGTLSYSTRIPKLHRHLLWYCLGPKLHVLGHLESQQLKIRLSGIANTLLLAVYSDYIKVFVTNNVRKIYYNMSTLSFPEKAPWSKSFGPGSEIFGI